MKHKNIMLILFGVVVGYLLSASMVCKVTLISTSSGAITEELRIFPFVSRYNRDDRAFSFLFAAPGTQPNDNVTVMAKYPFLNKLGISFDTYTSGNRLLAHQRMLLASFKESNFTAEERRNIAKNYFEKLSEGIRGSASDYVQEVWERSIK
ncbi:MAG: hypothetical protein V4640_11875 [Verrucomicrobiota bacterium]